MNIKIKNVSKDKIAAWAVHGFTASGAVLGFLAIYQSLTMIKQAHFFG